MIKGKNVLLTEKKGHIFIMTVNREERRNSISNELMNRMSEEWERFEEDDDLWVAIFTGGGDVAFSAGHDMKEDIEGVTLKPNAYRQPHPDYMTRKPTIAAVNGFCLAGGWWLAMRCDVRIAAEHATFGTPEVKWNLPAFFGARLEYLISMGIVCEMLMWGHTITAQRAYEVGFVNKVVPKEKLMDECLAWAEEACSLGLPSVMAHKEMIYRGRNMSVGELDALGRDLFYWWPPKPGVITDPAAGARKFFERKKDKA